MTPATMNPNTQPIVMELQAPLLNLAYTLTGNRTDAYSLLRDTTIIAMSESEAYKTREGLFEAMKRIFDTTYSSRATRRRIEVCSRPYRLPQSVATADAFDEKPEGAESVDRIHDYFNAILDGRYHKAVTMRAAGYRFREIANHEGISLLNARIRVMLGSISLRAAAALRR